LKGKWLASKTTSRSHGENKQEIRPSPAGVFTDGDPRDSRGSTGTLLVSSLAALQEIIRLVGFQSLELVHPNSPLHEQYVNFYRAIVFAFV
jgi:hypothetical protein